MKLRIFSYDRSNKSNILYIYYIGDNNIWCAQDGNGGIWKCEISPDGEPEKPEMLLRCHAGAVVAMDVCPFALYIATIGDDGRLHIYDCNAGKLVAYRNFPAKGQQLIWLPISVSIFFFFRFKFEINSLFLYMLYAG